MSALNHIQNLEQLSHERELLQAKAAREEQVLLREVDEIRNKVTGFTTNFNNIRSGMSRLKAISPFVLPVLRFLFNRRKRKKA